MTHPLSIEPNDHWKIDEKQEPAQPDEPGGVKAFTTPIDCLETLKDRLWCQSPGRYEQRRAHIKNGGTRHNYDYSKETR